MNRENLDTVVAGGVGLVIGVVLFVPGFIAGAAKALTVGSRLGARRATRALSH